MKDDAPLQFALPRAVAAIIDVERVPKLARDSGVRDLRFKYASVGHAVYVTCSRELAAKLLDNLRLRIRNAAVPPGYLSEYSYAVDRIEQALALDER